MDCFRMKNGARISAAAYSTWEAMMRYRNALCVAVVLASVAALEMRASAATAGCSITYQSPNVWQSSPTSGGFTTTLAITNLGDPIGHWTLTFTPPSGQAVT